MCGIAGVFDPVGRIARAELLPLVERMADRLRHRGPDAGGVWLDAEAGVSLAHRRLAVIDLSPTGSQPMTSRGGRYVLAFNGEIYNHQLLRTRLEDRGARFRGRSDTEVLLEWVAEWGIDSALDHAEGMFAISLWDRQRRELVLARDRFGEKPLYYSSLGGVFSFASELRPLLLVPGVEPRMDVGAIHEYFRMMAVPAPRSALLGVHKLTAGEMLRVVGDRLEIRARRHFNLSSFVADASSRRFQGTVADAEEEFLETLRSSVRQRLQADVPVGALLSGGVDSSLVVAAAQEVASGPVRTFSVSVREKGYDEAPFAAEVAHRLGTVHTEIPVAAHDILREAETIGERFDEPFADSSALVSLVVAREARKHVTVGLAGDGGDELFGGYPHYWRIPQQWRKVLSLRSIPGLEALAQGLRLLRRFQPLRVLQRELNAWGGSWGRRLGAFSAPDFESFAISQTSIMSAPFEASAADDSNAMELSSLVAQLGERRALMLMDLGLQLPEEMLVKMDRASMTHALEVRLPFLDTAMLRFSATLPDAWLWQAGSGKWLLKRVLMRRLPDELVLRPKQGFSVPIGSWLVGPLRSLAESRLKGACAAMGEVVSRDEINSIWRDHQRRPLSWRHEAWALVCLQSWWESLK